MLGPEDFAGRWTLARSIDDRRGGQGGRFHGTARLTPAGDARMTYAEEGHLRLGNAPPVAAHRAYLWTFDAAGIAVLFDDGRPFHRFAPTGRVDGTDHPCGADLYRVTYDFRHWPEWTAEWHVTGPRKEYSMLSSYRR